MTHAELEDTPIGDFKMIALARAQICRNGDKKISTNIM